MHLCIELDLWILKSYSILTFCKGDEEISNWHSDSYEMLVLLKGIRLLLRKCLCNKKLRPNAQSSLVVGIQTSKACFTLKILLQRIKCKPHFTFEFLSNVGSNKRSLYRMGCVLIISPLWNLIQKQKEEIQWSCAQNWHICIISITFCFKWEISL